MDNFSDMMLRLQGVKIVEAPRVSREVRPHPITALAQSYIIQYVCNTISYFLGRKDEIDSSIIICLHRQSLASCASIRYCWVKSKR